MRVAYVLAEFPKLSETFVVSEVDAVHHSDFEIAVFAASGSSKSSAEIATKIYYARSLPSVGALLGGLRLLMYTARLTDDWVEGLKAWWLACRLRPALTRFAPDVLHAQFATLPTLTCLLLARWLGLPATAMFHANDYLVGTSRQSLTRRVRALDGVCAVSDTARSEILHRTRAPENKVRVVRAAVARSVLQRTPLDRVAPGRASGTGIVCVARLVPKKGHEKLIRGYAELLVEAGPHPNLVIVGDGPERERLHVLITELGLGAHIKLLGARSHVEALDLVWSADAAALVSVVTGSGDADGIPVFLMEAAAAALPIVTTAVGGVPELVEDGRTGIVLTETTPAAVAAALRRALGPEGAATGASARTALAAEFDPDVQAGRLCELWTEVTSADATNRKAP